MWIRAVIIIVSLWVVANSAVAQDICVHCEQSGCLADYQTAKSDECKSCQICLKEPTVPTSPIPLTIGAEECEGKEQKRADGKCYEKIDEIQNGPIIFNRSTGQGAGKPQAEKRCKEGDDTAKCRDLRAQEDLKTKFSKNRVR